MELELEGRIANGRDIMAIVTLNASRGCKIMATATRNEAEDLLDALEDLFARQFDED